MKAKKLSFDDFYSEMLGTERWTSLKDSLLAGTKKVALSNPFVNELDKGLADEYLLDQASLAPAELLAAQPGTKTLDMCAAPGGKSLVMIFANKENIGQWVLNELSKNRIQRLRRVVREYLPQEVQAHIKVTNRDASRWGLYEANSYDRVLLDAPCSGEQHMLTHPKEIQDWKPARSQGLAQRQYALICAGLQSLKSGGHMVYSTCSISNLENDGVIKKLLKKKSSEFKLLPIEASMGEPTEFGWQIWPDVCEGWGPIYYSHIQKN